MYRIIRVFVAASNTCERARILLKSSLNFYLDSDIRKFVGVLRQRRSRNFMVLHYNFDDIPNSLSTAICEKKNVSLRENGGKKNKNSRI